MESINYDGRGNIDEMVYGNGTITNYEYADRTWTLMGSMVIGKPVGGSTAVSLLDRTYSYNSLGGIGTMQRVMDQSLVQQGETDHTFNFSYDSYNRLLEGKLDIAGVGPSYEVSTNFNDAGGITSKFSKVEPGTQTLSNNAAAMSYDLVYNYNPANPHQLEEAVDQMSGNTQHFTYNASGSIKQIQDNSQTQDFFWNEEQWLNAVQNEQGIHHYIYDHTGERIMKSSVIQSSVYVNDQIVNTIQDLEPYTLYVNPYFVITEFSNADKVSKHYYMGSQRVASELAVQTTSYSPLVSNPGSSSSASSYKDPYKTQTNTGSTLNQGLESALPEDSPNPWLNNLNKALAEFGKKTLTLEETQKELPTIESIYPDLSPQTNYKTASTQRVFYWYHTDYIGNVDLVTDLNGEAYELFLYNPWGENLYEWNSGTSSWSSPYRFNGKELDQETGNYYYVQRYYNPRTSLWLSVDRMASKYTAWSPYNFTINNPVNLIDPNGDSVLTKTQQEAQAVANDLNKIYKNKYGVEGAFSVQAKTRTAKERTNDWSITDPSSWGNMFEDPQYSEKTITEYAIVGNKEFNWNSDKYTRAMSELMRSKGSVYLDIVSDKGSGLLPYEKNGILSDYGGGYTKQHNWVIISNKLPLSGTNKGRQWTLGGLVLHELLYHVSPSGLQEGGDPNQMRNYYNLKTGKPHGPGNNQFRIR